MNQPRDQILVALDVDTKLRALELSDALRGNVGGFKIGSRLFTAEGPDLVSTLVDRGDRVFLDLKFHDIPTVVAEAVLAAARLGTWMLTVHTAGGMTMLRAAANAAQEVDRPPQVVGVTVLTSFDDAELARVGVTHPLPDQVEVLADLAMGAGLDGVVASPLEVVRLRTRLGSAATIVTPGIRKPAKDGSRAHDDQVRTLEPAEAVAAGSSYLVIGRPIIAAPDPVTAASAMVRELENTRSI